MKTHPGAGACIAALLLATVLTGQLRGDESAGLAGDAEGMVSELAAKLLALDCAGAQERLGALRAHLGAGAESSQWAPFLEAAGKAVKLDAFLTHTFRRQVGEVTHVELKKSGRTRIRLDKVAGGRFTGQELKPTQYGDIFSDISFTLDDVSLREKYQRLGKDTGPHLDLLRGILLYNGGAVNPAAKYFQRAGDPVGGPMLAVMKQREKERKVGGQAAAAERREAAARRGYGKLLAAAGLKPDQPMTELIREIRTKKFTERQIRSVEMVLEPLLTTFADTRAVTDNRAVFEALGRIRPGSPREATEEVLAAALEKLKKDNPGVEIKASFKKGEGRLELNLRKVIGVTDLSALAGLPITKLDLGHTGVSDLSPLAGMPLQWVCFYACEDLKDLKPLAGMPLTSLSLGNCKQVRDLSPLAGMRLQRIYIGGTSVEDLSPLQGMPLQEVQMPGAPVKDLAPLEGMKLRCINLKGTKVDDLSVLEDMEGIRIDR